MNQVSQIAFGTDITQASGGFQNANERVGNVDLIIENTDSSYDLVFQAKVQSTLTNSGFANVGSAVTVKPRGAKTVSYNIIAKKFVLCGSGVDSAGVARSITANVTLVLRNKGDLRGAQIDQVNVGRRGWGFDAAFNKPSVAKLWGAPPDQASAPTPNQSDNYGGDNQTDNGAGRGY